MHRVRGVGGAGAPGAQRGAAEPAGRGLRGDGTGRAADGRAGGPDFGFGSDQPGDGNVRGDRVGAAPKAPGGGRSGGSGRAAPNAPQPDLVETVKEARDSSKSGKKGSGLKKPDIGLGETLKDALDKDKLKPDE